MQDSGYMSFFEVEKCGLFPVKGGRIYGCDLDEVMSLIMEWRHGRPLAATIPWDPSKPKKGIANCYCIEATKDEASGDYLIVLCKSENGGNAPVWGFPDGIGGSGEVVELGKDRNQKNKIWGRPCYYWVIPSENIVVSIKYNHSVCDSKMFQEYIKECIGRRIDHPNRRREYTQEGHPRIFLEDMEGRPLAFRFSMRLKLLVTEGAELENIAKTVTHIVHRENIVVNAQDEKSKFVRLMGKDIRFLNANKKAKTRKVEVSIESRPSAADMLDIIENHMGSTQAKDGWTNVGFKTFENTMIWADKYRLKHSILINGQKDRIIEAKKILSRINLRRDEYLREIRANKNKVRELNDYIKEKGREETA